MKLIGNAMKMYLNDYDDAFPTNRPYLQDHRLGPISAYVKLSPEHKVRTKKAERYRYGVNWVESLYPYVEQEVEVEEYMSVWRCPVASDRTYPSGSDTARVTYVFNRNLVEISEGTLRLQSSLLLLRESDRLLNAELRPTNDTTSTSKIVPKSPFLTNWDSRIGKTKFELHLTGSMILFADGHVKLFYADCMPSRRGITKFWCWDAKTRQWYNFRPGGADPRDGSIAITP